MITDEQLDELIQDAVSAIQSPESIDYDAFQARANELLELTKTLNQKLTQIARMLNKGLRDEAIQEAGSDGRVLAIYERLDFPERDAYIHLIEEFGFARPPELNHDAATQLNAAFGRVGDIKHLLKNHRLLALSRATLGDRIGALNALAVADPDNPVWEQDSQLFQKTRLQQIQGEFSKAAQQQDVTAIEELDHELRTLRWSVPVPQKLATQVATLQAAHHKSKITALILAESDQLMSAYNEFDTLTGSTLADRIRELADSIDLLPDDPLLVEIANPLAWVDEFRENERVDRDNRKTCDEFASLLDRSDDRNAIERAYQKCRLMGEQFPDELRRRADERLESLKIIADRRTRIRIAAMAMGLLLLCGAMGAGGTWLYRESHAKAIEAEIQALVGAESWERANKLLGDQSISIRSRTQLVQAKVAIDKALKDESDRITEFQSILAGLKNDQSKEPQISKVDRLKALAKLPEELDQAKEQEASSRTRVLAKNEEINQARKVEFKSLEQELRTVMSAGDATRIRAGIRQLQSFQESLTSISPHLNIQSDALITEGTKYLGNLDSLRRESAACDSITRTIGKADEYLVVLQSFAKQFPESPMGYDLNSKGIDEWRRELEGVQAIQRLLSSKAYKSTNQATASEVSEWISQTKDFINKPSSHHAWLPLLDSKRNYLSKLEKIADAIQKLKEIGDSELLGELYEYTFPDGKFVSATRPDPDTKIIDYIVDTSLLTKEKKLNATVAKKAELSKASVFGKSLRLSVKKMNESNFSPVAFEILKSLKETEGLDPIFQALLLKRILETACLASQPIAESFGRNLTRLDEESINYKVNWIGNDVGKSIVRERENAKQILENLFGDWLTQIEVMKKSYTQSMAIPLKEFQWVGWIAKEGDKWVLRLREPSPNAVLFVVTGQGKKARVVSLQVAKPVEGTIIQNTDLFGHLSGKPVYAMDELPASFSERN